MISTAPAPNGGFEHRPSISLVGIQTGWGEAASIDFDYNGKRISVSLVSSDTSGSRKTGYHGALTEDQLINKLTQSMASEEFDEDVNSEAIGIIVDAGKDFFATIPPFLTTTSFQQQTLHSLLYPETFYLRFRTVDGNHTVTQVAAPKKILNFRSEFQIYNNLP
ncbi:hypothetical protein TWF225_008792 [Orbilia oligospora]|nr:hypothetical protein TWF225_008792 [Orbilia oligospora]KAF3254592.1 hypothetical protein TWF217_006810 [Orbilia oligospora]